MTEVVVNKKLIFLVKKIAPSLKITEVNEDNINILIQNLLISHREYSRMPRTDLKESVQKSLQSVLSATIEDATIPSDNESEKTRRQGSSTPTSVQGKKRKRPSTIDSDMPPGGTKEKFARSTDNSINFSSTLAPLPRPSTRLSDLAGLESVLSQVREMVFFPTQLPELYSHLGHCDILQFIFMPY
jgi:hypothetical protein